MPPSRTPPRQARLHVALIVVVALLASLPGTWAGAEYYIDNATHVLEVELLAREILPAARSYVGWTDGANTGMAVGQLNAPLAWVPLAFLSQLGLPAALTTRLVAALANVVLALGAWALGRTLFRDPLAALLGALLAATSPADLWGVGGAMGGMWPYRLANGLLLAGLALGPRPRRAWQVGLWLAVILATHTFTGQVAFALAGLAVLTALADGRRTDAVHTAGGIVLALLVMAGFWIPLLDPALRTFPGMWHAPLGLAVVQLTGLPIEQFALQSLGRLGFIGGAIGAAHGVVVLAGAAWALRSGQLRRPVLARRAALFSAVLAVVVVICLVIPLGILGPNPWRHLAIWRLALDLAAGAGLAAMLARLGATAAQAVAATLGTALAAASLAVGVSEIPARADPDTGRVLGALEATWADLAERDDVGRVFQFDTFLTPGAPAPLRWSHPGGVPAAQQDLDLVGSWYGVTPVPTVLATATDGGLLFGVIPSEIPDPSDFVRGRLAIYGVDAVVTVTPGQAAAVAALDDWTPVSRHDPFAGFVRTTPALAPLGAPPPARVVDLEVARGRVEARLESAEPGPIPFRLRRTWHPWWQVTLDGRPVPVQESPDTGMLEGTAPGPGTLVLTWVDQGRRWGWLSLAGLVLLGLSAVPRRRGREPAPAPRLGPGPPPPSPGSSRTS